MKKKDLLVLNDINIIEKIAEVQRYVSDVAFYAGWYIKFRALSNDGFVFPETHLGFRKILREVDFKLIRLLILKLS